MCAIASSMPMITPDHASRGTDVRVAPGPNEDARIRSGRGDVPGSVEEVVARAITRLRVLREVVERAALEGPLPGTVVARDDGPVARGLRAVGGSERRPVRGASAVAHALAGAGGAVAVEDVQRHLVGTHQGAVRRHCGSCRGAGSHRTVAVGAAG